MHRLRQLDGLRAAAILPVIATHTGIPELRGGRWGVDVFFVLSGYLITGVLLRHREVLGRFDYASFYRNRIVRLYPALLVMVLLFLPWYRRLALTPHPAEEYSVGTLLAVTYLTDLYIEVTHHGHGPFGHTWSLAVEEQFYLLWPLTMGWLLRRSGRQIHVLLLLAIAGSYVLMVFQPGVTESSDLLLSYFNPLARAGALLLGCLLALHLRPGTPRKERDTWTLIPLLILGGLYLSAAGQDTFERAGFVSLLFGLTSTGIIWILVTRPISLLARVLAVRPLSYTGQISYGMYLFHYPLLGVVPTYLPHLSRSQQAVVTLLVTYVVASFSFFTVERLFQRWKSPGPAGLPESGSLSKS